MKDVLLYSWSKQDTDQSDAPPSETPLFKRLKIFSTNPLLLD